MRGRKCLLITGPRALGSALKLLGSKNKPSRGATVDRFGDQLFKSDRLDFKLTVVDVSRL